MATNHVTLARPYARAAFAEAGEDRRAWSALLEMLGAVVADAQMLRLLRDPRVDHRQLSGLLQELCGERVSDARHRRFITLLLEAGRMEYAPEIYRQFEELRRRAECTVAIRVVSAYPLEDTAQLGSLLEQRLGRRVEMTVAEDRSLLGGLCIYLGDEVIDYSIRGRLHQLADTLHVSGQNP